MREIKFRAWDKENNKFFEPTYKAYAGQLEYLILNQSGSLSMVTMNEVIHESLFPDRFIKLQYTGLKDKNGNEIYEGDILKLLDTDILCDVVYKPPSFCRKWLCQMVINLRGHKVEPMAHNTHIAYEVIGNIYENPELLKE